MRFLILMILLLSLAFPYAAAQANSSSTTATELMWDDLMPEDYTLSLYDLFGESANTFDSLDSLDDFSPEAEALMDRMLQVLASAPVREELDGKIIRIPGFVVPLEADMNRVTRFFLVPYFGACIHVPPPPSNQIINVHFEPGTRVESLYDAIWIEGRLSTETFNHEMGTSGYTIEAVLIEPYDFDEAEEGEW
jgi:hypothetical protein